MDSFASSETLIRRGNPLPSDFDELGIGLTHHFVGGDYAKLFRIPAGKVIGQHSHRRGHFGSLLIGKVRIEVDGKTWEVKAPHNVYIDAEQEHIISAIEDSLWACIWSNPDLYETPAQFDRSVT